MVVTKLPMERLVRPSQPEKADSPMVVTVLGMVKRVKLRQTLNASLGIVVS